MIELLIQNGNTIYFPIVEDNIQLELERKGVPGKLTFSVAKGNSNDITSGDTVNWKVDGQDVVYGNVNFTEGNAVSLKVDGQNVFYGFIFSKQRDKGDIIKVTAYDQLRYLKNKDTCVYKNMTASELVKKIASEFRLQVGNIDDTAFKIESRVEDNKTLFDIIQTSLDLTLMNRKTMYVLYDDFGKLTLKNINNMKLNLLIDEETGENFDYTSSIDGQTYNKIKLSYNNEKTGKRENYIVKDSTNINNWGVLQYFENIDEKTNGRLKAEAMLSLYNKKTRNLTVNNAFGDVRVRGGSVVIVKLNLGDINVANYMIVEKVKHTFQNDHHTMSLTLKGGDFNV